MIKTIVIKVTDKVPELVSGPDYVVCDNSDYTVVWQLDEEWAQFEHRTMQVNYKDGTYERVLFTGSSCTLPAIPVSGPVHVGLFAGDIHTTRPARLLAVRSATTDSGEERDPMPNGYAQAIKALDAKLDKNQGADNAGKALIVGDDGNVVPGEAQGGSSLPAMSSDTAGKMLTNDGKNPEWGGAVRYDVAQTLTDANRQMGRSNIGAFPGKTLQYFFDTTTGATHDNDIFAAHIYDVIFPGNTYSDGTHSNAGMKFPAYVVSYEFITERYVQIRLLDGNGAVWNVVKSSHTLFDCSKIVEKQVMCVNFTQGDDGNWSADKNWDDAAALIKSGGLVYTNISISVCFGAFSVDGTIRFMVQPVSPGGIDVIIYDWKQNGKIDYIYKIIPVLKSDDPVVRYDEQTLTADEQAQARKNIGAGDNTLGITGARVGQIAKITAVDASGVPTAWSPVDMAGGDKWEKLIDTSLAESVESVTYTFDDCKRTKALIAPALASDESYSGWTRISINNVSYPLFNSKVDAIKGIYFAVDSVYPPYVQASLGTNSNTSTHGFIGGSQTTALENIAPNGITELGCQTAKLLKAGTKIEIWGVKS